jgi:hypothetical protein
MRKTLLVVAALVWSAASATGQVDVTYAGTIENQNSIKGTVTLGGLGDGTFTARRQ